MARATGAPDSAVKQAVNVEGLFGQKLRHQLEDTLRRQLRFSVAVEQLPDNQNRVSIDPKYRDAIGNPRPVIDYRIDDYTLEGWWLPPRSPRRFFSERSSGFHRNIAAKFFPSVDYKGRSFEYHGMGHFAGTHAMGSDRSNSVVDRDQRSWDHPNLFLVGSGSFPTMGTSNPTLTLAALALRTADTLIATLQHTP